MVRDKDVNTSLEKCSTLVLPQRMLSYDGKMYGSDESKTNESLRRRETVPSTKGRTKHTRVRVMKLNSRTNENH